MHIQNNKDKTIFCILGRQGLTLPPHILLQKEKLGLRSSL